MRSATVELPTPRTDTTFLVAIDREGDPTSTVTLELGLQLAREAGARVVLYDRSAESFFIDPYEAPAWAGGQLPSWDQLLSPVQLRRLGYGYLAEQLTYARAMGLDAAAWLPFGTGPAAMARCCAAWAVTHVVLPARVTRPSWWARLRRHTLAAFQASMPGIEFLLVDADSGLHRIAGTAGKPQPARMEALV